MKMTDDELLKKAYLERSEDELVMALAARVEELTDGLAALALDIKNLTN